MSDALLTDEHVREYWERGFTVVRELFGPEELAAWDARFLDIAEKRVPVACEPGDNYQPPKSTRRI